MVDLQQYFFSFFPFADKRAGWFDLKQHCIMMMSYTGPFVYIGYYLLCIIMDFVGHFMLGGGKVQMLWSNLNSLNWYFSGWWKQFLFILFLGEGLCNSWEEPVQGILTPGSSLYPAQKLPVTPSPQLALCASQENTFWFILCLKHPSDVILSRGILTCFVPDAINESAFSLANVILIHSQ